MLDYDKQADILEKKFKGRFECKTTMAEGFSVYTITDLMYPAYGSTVKQKICNVIPNFTGNCQMGCITYFNGAIAYDADPEHFYLVMYKVYSCAAFKPILFFDVKTDLFDRVKKYIEPYMLHSHNYISTNNSAMTTGQLLIRDFIHNYKVESIQPKAEDTKQVEIPYEEAKPSSVSPPEPVRDGLLASMLADDSGPAVEVRDSEYNFVTGRNSWRAYFSDDNVEIVKPVRKKAAKKVAKKGGTKKTKAAKDTTAKPIDAVKPKRTKKGQGW